MDDYLTKPFKRDSFGAVLARWLAPSGLAATLPATPVTTAAIEEASILNSDALRQLREVFDGDISGVVGSYLSDAQTQIHAMENALGRRVSVELERAAHSLKSTSRSVGADSLAGLCAELETMARNEGCVPHAAPLVREIRERFAVASAALSAEREVRERIPAA
jgi:HPt (histidine-containing phosphotransfer) domain-containing protein